MSLYIRHIKPVVVFLLVAVVLLFVSNQRVTQAAPKQQSATDCQALVTRALDSLHDACDGLSRNRACYGNDRVAAELTDPSGLPFQQQGDIVPIKAIKSLVTYPLDTDKGTWGLTLLKLQANLPDTMPGQNVTFLVYGNTTVQNASNDMQVFYFSTGLGQPTCTQVPADGIVVQSPNHTQVAFTANGVNITIASTIVLQAEPNKSMSVSLIEGHATVKTKDGSQTLTPGQYVTIPLGGDKGLEAVGAPSAPAAIPDGASSSIVVNAVGGVSDPDPADSLTTKDDHGKPIAIPPKPTHPPKGNGKSDDKGGKENDDKGEKGNNGNKGGNGNGNGNGNGGDHSKGGKKN